MSPALTLRHDPEKCIKLEGNFPPTDVINPVPFPSIPEPPISILRNGPRPSHDGIVIVERYQTDKKSSLNEIEKPPPRVNVPKPPRPLSPPVKSGNKLMFFVTNPSKISLSTNSSHRSKKSKRKEANAKVIESSLTAANNNNKDINNNNDNEKPLDLLQSLSMTSNEHEAENV